MQLRILWEELLARFDKIEVVGEPTHVQSNFVKGYEKMMVKLTAKVETESADEAPVATPVATTV